MFIRRKKNKSGSTSIQIIDKSSGKYTVLKTIGCAESNSRQEQELVHQAQEYISAFTGQCRLDFCYPEDASFLKQLQEGLKKLFVVGPELILGKIFEEVGYHQIPQSLFRHLVLTRLVYPGSKLKTVDYLQRYKGVYTNEDKIYRYMDRFDARYKQIAIDITFEHTKQVLNNRITVAFYDITTLYFEASDEDDLRRLGFSKDGKAQNPQILLALLVSVEGFPLAYEIFEGDKYEGHTLIPVVKAFKKKYSLPGLIIVADAGLLSAENTAKLTRMKYPFILGSRMKNENESVKQQILSHSYTDGVTVAIQKSKDIRLIVNYSAKRAKKDQHMRQQGIERLEKSLKSGKLTKEKINNRGYNKYLIIKNQIDVEIDYRAFHADDKWNGLKGYITNCNLSDMEIINHYKQLWSIEKAFRISKTDLRIRPVYHRLERRIRTHICIAFCSYKIYKELERQLKVKDASLSVDQVLMALKTIYQAQVVLPHSKKKSMVLLPLDDIQKEILRLWDIAP